jgi:uncharacterized protein YcgL (UPF0745 family)
MLCNIFRSSRDKNNNQNFENQEDDLCGRRPPWMTTSMEDDLNRGNQQNMLCKIFRSTQVEGDLYGRRPHCKMT